MSEERRFGAIRSDGVRHAAYGAHSDDRFGTALCDYKLQLAFCEPLQPDQPTCNRQPCKRYAEEARQPLDLVDRLRASFSTQQPDKEPQS